MRSIDVEPFLAGARPPKSDHLGIRPDLRWIKIADLRINPKFQREVLSAGRKNILSIAENFNWAQFGVVVVASIGEGLFSIVDGQHRTIGAALREIEAVPCIVIDVDEKQQAAAFAAINGAVTVMNPLSIFYAKLAAGDRKANDLADACKAAGVKISRYPRPANTIGFGETLAVGALEKALKSTSANVVTLGLKGLLASSRGKAGLLRAGAIKAVARCLESSPELGVSWARMPARFLAAMEGFHLEDEMDIAALEAKRMKVPADTALFRRMFNYLERELG